MSNEIDNQQATQREIGWLAGILDGEGTLVMTYQTRKNGKVTSQPFVRIVNTSDEVLDKSARILDKLGVSFFLMKLEKDKTRLGNKDVFSITIQRIEEIKKLLDIILEDLTEKKARASLMLRYCNIRIKNGFHSEYTNEEREIIDHWRDTIRTK